MFMKDRTIFRRTLPLDLVVIVERWKLVAGYFDSSRNDRLIAAIVLIA